MAKAERGGAEEEEEEEAPIHGDILEAIFSHVPLIHLVAASQVSKSWKRAVYSSLAHVNPIKPWLTLLTQSTRAPHITTSHAYDPRSRLWLHIKHHPSINLPSAVRSSHSTLLYTITPAAFSFSSDALHINWHHAPSPRVWRTDPIVARLGNRLVVAGGACDFEDDPLAVEVYDLRARQWVTCQSMPSLLKGSTASTWLSVAVAGQKMLVTEKNSGVTYAFDTNLMTWQGAYDLRPDENVFYCVAGTLGKDEQLTVAGFVGDAKNVKGVKLWSVKGELGSGSGYWFEDLGEMPKEMVEKVKGGWELGSVEVAWVGEYVYVMNKVEVVVCEVASGVSCEWWSVRNVAVKDGGFLTKRVVVGGGDVCLEDLQLQEGIAVHELNM